MMIINDHQILDMLQCCVAAGYNTSSGMGYSLHLFLKDKTLRRKWNSVRSNAREATGMVLCQALFCAQSTLRKTVL